MLKWILICIVGGLLHSVWDSVNPYPEKEKPWTEWDTIFVYLYMSFILYMVLDWIDQLLGELLVGLRFL